MAHTLDQAKGFIDTANAQILPGKFHSRGATVLMLAIGLQESGFVHPIQLIGNDRRPVGPARGYWQFERGGGVVGVMNHGTTSRYTRAACNIAQVAFNAADIHYALAFDHVFAAALARLLLWTDPRATPAIGDEAGAFDYYIRNWRPGAFKRDPGGVRSRFGRSYREAMRFR